MASNKKLVDIRAELPVAVKGGTSSKPVWNVGDKMAAFVRPLDKFGRDKEGHKPIMGKRVLAKYVAGKTKKGEDLLFVGMFRLLDGSTDTGETGENVAPAAPEAVAPVAADAPVLQVS